MAYYYPSGMIAPFDSACPTGWTRVSALDSKFVRGAAAYGGSGGAETHSHVCSAASHPGINDPGTALKTTLGANFDCSTWYHVHSVNFPSTTSGSANQLPPYINVIFCKKT